MTRKELINRAAMTLSVSTRGIKLVDNEDGSVDVYVHDVYICTRKVEDYKQGEKS